MVKHNAHNMPTRVAEEAARAGFLKTRGYGNDPHRTVWEITCSKCPQVHRAMWPPYVATEQFIKVMRTRGWDVGMGMRPLCPACAHKKDKAPEPKPDHHSNEPFVEPMPDTMIYHQLLDAAAMTTRRQVATGMLTKATQALHEIEAERDATAHQIDELRREEKQRRKDERTKHREARRAARAEAEAAQFRATAERMEKDEDMINGQPNLKITHAVFQLLDSVFDRNKHLYHGSYSDDRVAKDCGTTSEIVSTLRKEIYGELADDPRIATVADDLALLDMQFQDMVKSTATAISDLRSRIDQLRTNLHR